MSDADNPRLRGTYAVWELTLKCNLACLHCGSRAADARPAELTTDQALDVVRQLKDVGIGEVTLIGGEAYLRPDWLIIARAIHDAGMLCSLTTGGLGITARLAERMRDAGIESVSVSLDGLEPRHDLQRGRKGSFRHALAAIRHLADAGLHVGCNTQINRLTAPDLPLLYTQIRDAGARAWQLQLTVPMGNAADNSQILLQPVELLDVFPMLALIADRAREDGILIQPGNNLGYFGPYERLLRHSRFAGNEAAATGRNFWQGCGAGASVLGIESDGTLKGCPSLPTAAYSGGNLKERTMQSIIREAPALNFMLDAGEQAALDQLWGFCRECEFARLCRAGCTWTAHVFFDRRGNNPYCHHRALSMARRGRRERVVLKRQASGQPFDNGEFELIEEALDGRWPDDDPLRFTADQIRWPAGWNTDPSRIRPHQQVDSVQSNMAVILGSTRGPSRDRSGKLPRMGWQSAWALTTALTDAERSLQRIEAASDPLYGFRTLQADPRRQG